MLEEAARTYSEVFAPELFVLACGVLVVGYEWSRVRESPPGERGSGRGTGLGGLDGLGARLGALGLGWGVAFAVYRGLPELFRSVPSWAPDATGSVGLGVGLIVIWAVWRLRGWGDVVPEFALVLVAVTVPHLLITPVWDVSSHVIYAAVPAGYLAALDRRFAPLLLVPFGMVPGRPLAGAHTWPQSVGGLVFAGLVLWLFLRSPLVRERGPTGERPV